MILGLILAVVLAVGVVWYTQTQTGKVVERTRPDEFPVPSDRELQFQLSQEQYNVTRKNGTETAFRNAYWDNFKPGIYVDIITNEPLFSSLDKSKTAARAGRVLPSRLDPGISSKNQTPATTWFAPNCGPKKATRISATFSTMARRRRSCAIL